MEELGREMIGGCRGIPLALVVLRGVLVTKATLYEWERFYINRTRKMEHQQLKGGVIEVLLLSYNELPYQLRPCFLYLGNFLENEEIETEKLYMLWDAEGMLLSTDRKDGETMMDVAERYLGELVVRSMVEAELEEDVHPNRPRRVKSCRLHDLTRELCLSVVKKEKFLKVNGYRTQESRNIVLDSSCLGNDTKTPRISLYFPFNSYFSVDFKQEEVQNVLSLRFVGGFPKKLSNLKKFKFLRVLDFDKVCFVKEKLTEEIIHLKYLSINYCSTLEDLPLMSMGNYLYLQSRDQRITFANVHIPNLFLKKMERLRHLFLPLGFKVTPAMSRLQLEGLTELETLVNFDSKMCEGEIHISSEDDCKDQDWKGLITYLKMVYTNSSRLSSLIISLDGPQIETTTSEDLREQLQGCEGLIRKLRIVGLRGVLPQIFDFTSLLSTVFLWKIYFEEDPMPIFEKLPNLEDLMLMNVELEGKEMVCSAMGFPQLSRLTIRNVKNMEKWTVQEGAMPNLFILEIGECSKLEMLPDGLRFIFSLDYLKIHHMPVEFRRRIRDVDGGEGVDFYKIQHVRMYSEM